MNMPPMETSIAYSVRNSSKVSKRYWIKSFSGTLGCRRRSAPSSALSFGSSGMRIGSSYSRQPHLHLLAAVGRRDHGVDSPADVEVPDDLNPPRADGGNEVVEDPLGDRFVKRPLVSVRPDVALQALRLH